MKMRKEKYERTELELIRFESEDVIMTSSEDEYEGENPGAILPLI